MSRTLELITSSDEEVRNRSVDRICAEMSLHELQDECRALDAYWRAETNLYRRVRAIFFLSTIYRYHLPSRLPVNSAGLIPAAAHDHLLSRRFGESVDCLLASQSAGGPDPAHASALAAAYRSLAFETLFAQVRRSVRIVRGNQWMFRLGHPADQPLRVRRELLPRTDSPGDAPVLRETTAVRMDFSHSGWSDIFFLAMDFPEGARVINASINLAVRGRDAAPRPPIETYLRVIDRPVLRLVSTDLEAQAEITQLAEVFDFARDYLGLLKAAVIAAGLVSPGMEGCQQPIAALLEQIVGPGRGLEIVSQVNDIPKGSRLAVSTNLLGSLIALCMRATGQVQSLTGGLTEAERRVIAARCILAEWLGGSGGGWQDSGGVWPGVKLICGEVAQPDDPEYGISRGRLLPVHHVFSESEISPDTWERLQNSLVLVHGGMAQNVGPILEMVTEKYLLKGTAEWAARQEAIALLDEILAALRRGDIQALGRATTRNFEGPLQAIIPWCTNLFTNEMIRQSRERFGEDFWGFWMLGGMAGGGMGFLFAPHAQSAGKHWLQESLRVTKRRLEHSLPFAMEPVVYDFEINDRGTWAELRQGDGTPMPDQYYALTAPEWLRIEPRRLSPQVRRELEMIAAAGEGGGRPGLHQRVLSRLLPQPQYASEDRRTLGDVLREQGFDAQQHELIRQELRAGRIGLSQNRLPASSRIEDVTDGDVLDVRGGVSHGFLTIGQQALERGEAAVVTLAAGVGSRWTEGAGVVKALHPFCRIAGMYRRFIDVHLAKSRRTGRLAGADVSHVFTTSYLTERPIREYLSGTQHEGLGDVLVSPGRSVGLRTIPTLRDLEFAWTETAQQQLDEQHEKVRASVRAAWREWAQQAGEAADYTDNVPLQCLHPVGHWYEVPNMLRNGTLARLLHQRPQLKYLLIHNIDTLGANLDPGLLGAHIGSGSCLTYEVIPRRIDDRGGGLARVDGRPRLVEGLALPNESDEFKLRYYNSLTTWVTIDRLLAVFGLDREQLGEPQRVDAAVRRLSQRLPTYITLKDVKKRWGRGQEDVYPVTQFEKLWGDMSALPEVDSGFFVVPLQRGQQLKQQAQLDGWLRDGSAAHIESLCDWPQN